MKEKLVRDKIIEIIRNSGKEVEFYVSDEKEYWERLKEKLQEEVNEVLEEENILEEIADVLEVLHSIAEFKKNDFQEIEKKRIQKKEERGGFKKRIVLKTILK